MKKGTSVVPPMVILVFLHNTISMIYFFTPLKEEPAPTIPEEEKKVESRNDQ